MRKPEPQPEYYPADSKDVWSAEETPYLAHYLFQNICGSGIVYHRRIGVRL